MNRKEEKTQISKIRNEREVIFTNLKEIKRTIRNTFMLENLYKKDKFLERQKLPILTHEEIKNLNRTSKR